MSRLFIFASLLIIFSAGVQLDAQERANASQQAPRRRALIIDINARVLEETQEVVWNEVHRKITIPGSPVGIKLVGSNIVVAVQFTPVIRRQGNVLVAQGQIWIEDPEKGIRYYTSIQTIPMEFNEPIYFFPLGASAQINSSIEIVLTVNPYSEIAVSDEAAVTNDQ